MERFKRVLIAAGTVVGVGTLIYFVFGSGKGTPLGDERHMSKPMQSNGGRTVEVWLPAGFDASKPARLLTYFHGHGGPPMSGDLSRRVSELGVRFPNLVFVYPHGGAIPFSYWMATPESFDGLEREIVEEASLLAGVPVSISGRIVAGASGGGLAIRNATKTGLKADRVELLDSAYGDWAQTILKWAQTHGAKIEAWHTGGPTETNDLDIARLSPELVTIHKSTVVHGAVPGKYLGTGLEYV